VRPRKLCTRRGSEIGREKMHSINTIMAGRREAHDSRMQGSAKSNGLGLDGQSMTRHSCDDLNLRENVMLVSRCVSSMHMMLTTLIIVCAHNV
jgi:hypothetical protein